MKDITGMKFASDAQSLTTMPYLETKTLKQTIGVDLSKKERKTTSTTT